MAAPRTISGNTGSLTLAGCAIEFNGFDLEAAQEIEDSTGYTDTNDTYNTGNGIRDWTLDAQGFALLASAPGLAAIAEDAVAGVATAATGKTYTGNFVVQSMKISSKKKATNTPVTVRAKNQGAVAEAWS